MSSMRCGGAVGGTPFTGGQATVVGTLIGALLIQLVRYTLLANGVPDAAALVVKGAIIPPPCGRSSGRAPYERRTARPSRLRGRTRSLGGGSGDDRARPSHPIRRAGYEHFLGAYNVLSVLRYNSMFALTSLGMCFVIMSAGIDLSVGTTAAFASVVSALLSPYGLLRDPRRLGRGARGRRHQRVHGHADEHLAVHRHAFRHAGGKRNRPSAGA